MTIGWTNFMSYNKNFREKKNGFEPIKPKNSWEESQLTSKNSANQKFAFRLKDIAKNA